MTSDVKSTCFLDYTNEELFLLYKQTNRIDVKQEIALRYIYIVKSVALQMRNVYLKFDQVEDIVNEGVIMLMNAIDKFDLDKNIKFETYISKRVRGMVIDLARKKDWVSRTVRKGFKDIEEAKVIYYSLNGKEASISDISNMIGLSEEKCLEIMDKASMSAVVSLDMVIEEVGEQRRTLQVPSDVDNERPEERLITKELHEVLSEGIKLLKEKEQIVISLYYIEEINMKEISAVMNISEARVSQLHSSALSKLKNYLKAEGVK